MIISDENPGFYVSHYPLNIFVEDIGVLMLLLFPAAIGVVLWKMFVTNRTTPRGNGLSLGLDETSATPTELYGRKIPWGRLFVYAAVGMTTFDLGLYVHKIFYSIQEWFSHLNGGFY